MAARDWLKDPRKRGYVAMAILGLVLLSLAWPVLAGRDARHLTAYRDGEEDVSRFHAELVESGVGVRSIHSTPYLLEDVEDATRTLLVILGTERRYSPGEAVVILDFLRAGGNVILADETGFGTDIAREAGFAFSSESVLDTQNYRDDPKLVVATAKLGANEYRLLFNAPTSLTPLTTASEHDVLVSSSSSVYPSGSVLDRNANGEIDIADSTGPFPLVLRTMVGPGTLVLVSDTGLFMNGQVGVTEYDNAKFLRALVTSLVPQDGLIVLDESRHAPTALHAPWDNGVRALARLTSGTTAPLLTLLVLSVAALLAWRFTRQTEDWSHHTHDVSREGRLPPEIVPDAGRLQRMARRRVSERFNIPLEQVAAMKTEELQALTGDRFLSDAAAGDVRGDPGPLFRSFSDIPPEATP